MKKYHHRPTFGVKSGTNKWKPYVADTNSQKFPVMRYDRLSSAAMLQRNLIACRTMKTTTFGGWRAFCTCWS